ncbi:MAG: DUF4160 domain-containing protein [Clostridiales bacterium]|nr:DUF4160 domain-containing protein [Clostridiales bacterium]
MPQIFKIGEFIIYFWSNENDPVEPIHVHIAEHNPKSNATKVWITKSGKALLCNNNSKISSPKLRQIMRIIEANSEEIMQRWYNYFGEISFYC